jgi:NTE family protein
LTRVIAVLSGGGAKCAAQIGALRALEEFGLQPSHFVGTSMGAVIGACFAAGLDYEEVLVRVTTVSRRDVAAVSPTLVLGPYSGGILRADSLRETIADLIPVEEFSDLEKSLTVTAVDERSGDLVLFGEGGREHVPLAEALYASCALPLYYPPGQIGDRRYVDGGLRSVLPLEVALGFDPELLFAVRTGPSLYAVPDVRSKTPPLLKAHTNALRILMAVQTDQEIARVRSRARSRLLLVDPKLRAESTFRLDNVERFVEDGYRKAVRALSEFEPAE